MARGLVPVTVERLGIEASLHQVAEDLTRVHGTPVAADLHLGGLEPDDQTAIQLFRIAHEAATNAAKHAQAESIIIRLRPDASEDNQLLLEVTDDGVGISSEGRADSMGLRIMDYRARLIGGFLQVERRPEGGTRVSCRLSNVPDRSSGERSGLYTLPS
jgi:signal transduction histidine kinase